VVVVKGSRGGGTSGGVGVCGTGWVHGSSCGPRVHLMGACTAFKASRRALHPLHPSPTFPGSTALKPHPSSTPRNPAFDAASPLYTHPTCCTHTVRGKHTPPLCGSSSPTPVCLGLPTAPQSPHLPRPAAGHAQTRRLKSHVTSKKVFRARHAALLPGAWLAGSLAFGAQAEDTRTQS
jgi:hypothetical protein